MYVYLIVSTRPLASKVGFSSRLVDRLRRHNTGAQQWNYGALLYVPSCRRLSGRAIARYIVRETPALSARVALFEAIARELTLPLFMNHQRLSAAHARCSTTQSSLPPLDAEHIQRVLDEAERATQTRFRTLSFERAPPPLPPRLDALPLRTLVSD